MRRLRVIIGAATYPPEVNGAARFAQRLAAGLAGRGHDVHVICSSTDTKSSRTEVDGVTVHRIRSYATPVHPTFRVVTPWDGTRAVRRLLDEINPDVVHVQSHFFLGRALINSAHRRGIGLVATNHFMPENLFGYLKIPRPLGRIANRVAWWDLIRYYSRADLVTAPTPRAVDLLRDNGFHADALAISCGIDIERYRRPAAEYRKTINDEFRRSVLYVGRLDEEKNIDQLIRAMALLPASCPARLEIVGDGNCRAELEALAAELGIENRITFAGLVTEQELLAAYARCELFVMPSTAELQSLATMEAMAAGAAVVLADAMALPHLVKPGYNGFLFPPGDVRALADRIAEVLRDSDTVADMRAASQEMVAVHDINDILARFESIYRRTMSATHALRAVPSGDVVPSDRDIA